MMGQSYTFWHCRSNDLESVNKLVNEGQQSLRDNTWTSPLYISGSLFREDRNMRAEAACRFLNSLGENTSVSSLILQNAAMNEDMTNALCQALNRKKDLSSLTLRNLTSGGEERDSNDDFKVPPSVFCNPNLEALSLSGISLGPSSCEALAVMIRDSAHLKSLRLEGVTTGGGGLISVLAALPIARALESMALVNLSWSKADLSRLFAALSFNRTLQRLYLEQMGIDADDAPSLASFLRRNKGVKLLSLRKNLLDAQGLKILMMEGILKHTGALETVHLSRNPLGDNGAKYVVEFLQAPEVDQPCKPTLKALCLVETKIGRQGCQDICRALRHHAGSLRELCIDGNCMENDTCAQELLNSLQLNHRLQLCHVLDRLPTLLAREKGRPVQTFETEAGLWHQVDFFLRVNKARRHFLATRTSAVPPPAILPHVLEKAAAPASADVLFYLLSSSGNYFPAMTPLERPSASGTAIATELADVSRANAWSDPKSAERPAITTFGQKTNYSLFCSPSA